MTLNIQKPFIVGSLGLVLILLAILWNYWPLEEEVAVLKEEATPAPEVLPEPETRGEEVSLDEGRYARFDVIRLSPEGLGVFAGEGPSGHELAIFSNGDELGRVVVDERGEWVWLATEPLSSGSHTLSLRVKEGDAWLVSPTVAVVVVPDVEGEGFALLVPDVEGEGFEASTVLQRPNFQAGLGDAEESLGVDTIDYDDKGHVIISGRATPGSRLKLYLDEEKIGDVEMGETDRFWRFRPEGRLAEGRYRLKVEQLVGGEVTKGIELPFHHAAFVEDEGEEEEGRRKVVVQPGNSLWRIARQTLGEGVRYVIIYEANRDKIADEDLIYPGQVFTIPEAGVLKEGERKEGGEDETKEEEKEG